MTRLPSLKLRVFGNPNLVKAVQDVFFMYGAQWGPESPIGTYLQQDLSKVGFLYYHANEKYPMGWDRTSCFSQPSLPGMELSRFFELYGEGPKETVMFDDTKYNKEEFEKVSNSA